MTDDRHYSIVPTSISGKKLKELVEKVAIALEDVKIEDAIVACLTTAICIQAEECDLELDEKELQNLVFELSHLLMILTLGEDFDENITKH